MKKITDERLARFCKLNKQINKLNSERASIRKDIIATGATATKNFVAEVETLKKERLAGKSAFVKAFGASTLKRKGLISTYVSQEVNVVKKSEHIHNIKAARA